MFRAPSGATVTLMIRIWVDSTQPPTGRVVTFEGQPPRPYSGWLDLLGILADAMAAEREPEPEPGGPRLNGPDPERRTGP